MAWSTAFEELMADTVVVKSLSGLSTDGYGTPTFGSATTYTARVVRKQHLVRAFDGTEQLATTLIYIASTTTFAPETTEITAAGETPGTLLALDAFPDEDGVHHVRASYG